MTSQLLVRPHAPDRDGRVVRITPESAGWEHVGFELLRLADGQAFVGESDIAREICIVIVAGTVAATIDGRGFGRIGGRVDPFEDRAPGAVYVPAGSRFTITASGPAEVALCTAPGRPGRPPRIIEDADMPREVRGSGTNTRFVRNILPEGKPADGLLVVEVVTPAGHWSSYPPHKHDTAEAGVETKLEETYYHRLDPPQGYAVQRVYTDDRTLDECIAVSDGDVVLVPRGYHPVGAAHGYDLYYLNVMAGPERKWLFRNDPAHAWIASTPANDSPRIWNK